MDERSGRRSYSKDYLKKKAAFKRAEEIAERMELEPNVPGCYREATGKLPLRTHIDVTKFKGSWDKGLKDNEMVTESRTQGVRYKDKHNLRRALMDFAVKYDIAVPLQTKMRTTKGAGGGGD
jgi:hypothetical protein